jgi:hypothetical protein
MTIHEHDNSPTWDFDNMTIRQITIRQHDNSPTWHFANMTFRQHDISHTCHLTKLRWVCWLDEHSVVDPDLGSGDYPLDLGWIVFLISAPGSFWLWLSFWRHKKHEKSKVAFYFSCRIQDPWWKIVRIRIRDEKLFRSRSRILKLNMPKK